MAVYMAILKPGDTVLAMSLDHGGTSPMAPPSVRPGRDCISSLHMGSIETPSGSTMMRLSDWLISTDKLIVAGASAYPRPIDFARFGAIAEAVGAKLLVDMAHIAGLIAAGVHESPVPYADFITTTTHKTLRGPRGGMILGKSEDFKKVNSRIFPGTQGGPLVHVIAAKAVALKEALSPFIDYSKAIVANAKAFASSLKQNGCVW